MKRFLRGLFLSTLAVALAGGCLSTHPGSASLAYVVVPAPHEEAVTRATVAVFESDGYQLIDPSPGTLVFEREANQRDKVFYGRVEESLRMRVVVTVTPYRDDEFLVRSDAYVLRGSFSDKVLKMAARPYRNQLRRIEHALAVERKQGGS